MRINPIRGTHDLFGKEIEKFNRIILEVSQHLTGLKIQNSIVHSHCFRIILELI